jgi:hypothetical protein
MGEVEGGKRYDEIYTADMSRFGIAVSPLIMHRNILRGMAAGVIFHRHCRNIRRGYVNERRDGARHCGERYAECQQEDEVF